MKAFLYIVLSVLLLCSLTTQLSRFKLTKKTKTIHKKSHKKSHNRTLRNHHHLQETVLMLDFEDIEYSGDIRLGSNQQLFNLVFDTGSAYLWVASADCVVCPMSGIFESFNCSESTTCQQLEAFPVMISYGTGTLEGRLATDTVQIGTYVASQQEFIIATDLLEFPEMEAEGILGLGFEATSDGVTTVMDNLKLQNQISDRVFSFYLGGKTNSYDPQFTLDGYDSQLIASGSDLVYCDVIGNLFWTIKVNSVELRGSKGTYPILNVGVTESTKDKVAIDQAILDSGTSLVVLDSDTYTYLFDFLNVYVSCAMMMDYITCFGKDLTEYPDIVFDLCGTEYTLSPEDYLEDYGDFLLVMIEGIPDFYYVLLGNTFMRKYYSVFDQDNNRLGLALAAVKSDEEEEIDWNWAT